YNIDMNAATTANDVSRVAALPHRRFTVDEFYRMAEVGILTPRDRVELIEGEIVQMNPIGVRHAQCVDELNELLVTALQGAARVRVQNPVRLSNYSEPQPDVCVVKRTFDRTSS